MTWDKDLFNDNDEPDFSDDDMDLEKLYELYHAHLEAQEKAEIMSEHAVAMWRSVFSLSRDLYKLKPWSLIEPYDLLVIEKERSKYEDATVDFFGDRYYGYSVQANMGESGKWVLEYMMNQGDQPISERVMSRLIYQLFAFRIDYVATDYLPPDYHAFCKSLGFSFRGNWPLLTFLRKGMVHEIPDEADLEHVVFILEQLIQVAKDIKAKKVRPGSRSDLLKRYWSAQDNRWLYTRQLLDPHLYLPEAKAVDEFTMQRIKRMPYTDQYLSVDLFCLRGKFMNPDGSFSALLYFIASDDDSQQVIESYLVPSMTNELDEWTQFIIKVIETHGKPEMLTLDNEIIYEALDPLFDEIDISVALLENNPLHDYIYTEINESVQNY